MAFRPLINPRRRPHLATSRHPWPCTHVGVSCRLRSRGSRPHPTSKAPRPEQRRQPDGFPHGPDHPRDAAISDTAPGLRACCRPRPLTRRRRCLVPGAPGQGTRPTAEPGLPRPHPQGEPLGSCPWAHPTRWEGCFLVLAPSLTADFRLKSGGELGWDESVPGKRPGAARSATPGHIRTRPGWAVQLGFRQLACRR